MSKSILAPLASLAVLAFAAAGLSLAQSGSRPSGTPRPKPSDEKVAAAQAPRVIALSFYADWCPGCQELKPKLESLMKAAGRQPCLFVKLDQTNKESRQAEYLVAALGLGELWKEHGGQTGFTLLVEPRSKKVVGRLTGDQDIETMQSSLRFALGG
jgi:thiol-disulfide isomerase/thioredoxin